MKEIKMLISKLIRDLSAKQLESLVKLEEVDGYAILLSIAKKRIEDLKEESIRKEIGSDSIPQDYFRRGLLKGEYNSILFYQSLAKQAKAEIAERKKK